MLAAGKTRRTRVCHKRRIMPHMAPHVPGGARRVKNKKTRNLTPHATNDYHKWLHNKRTEAGAMGSCAGHRRLDQLDGTERPRVGQGGRAIRRRGDDRA